MIFFKRKLFKQNIFSSPNTVLLNFDLYVIKKDKIRCIDLIAPTTGMLHRKFFQFQSVSFMLIRTLRNKSNE